MSTAPNVLRQAPQSSESDAFTRSLFGRPSGRSYRAAVAQVIREIKARKKLSNEALAEEIGCSESTVYNAERESGNLEAVTLLNIAYRFGEEAIAPVRELYLCAPAHPKTLDDRFDDVQAAFNALRKDASA